MAEVGEYGKAFAQRKDSAPSRLRRGIPFYSFDRAAKTRDGALTQSDPFEDSGVLRAIGQPTRHSRDLFHAVFDISYAQPITKPQDPVPGNNLVLFATLPKGEVWASAGSQPVLGEGGHTVKFTLWRPVDRKMLDVAKKNKGDVLKEIRKRQAQPLPQLTLDELKKVGWSIT